MFKHSVANKYTVVAKTKGEIITPATIDTRNVKDVAALILNGFGFRWHIHSVKS